jgi:hypothetical protein
MLFNADGSLKLPTHISEQRQRERSSIILRKVQISTRPAVAHIKIEFPDSVYNPQRVMHFYNYIKNWKYPEVDHTIRQADDKTFVIEVKKGSFKMYSLLDYLIERFREELSKDKNVVVKGSWESYESREFN